MNNWIIYGIMAGVSFGLSAVPMRCAARTGLSTPPQLLVLASCVGSIVMVFFTGIFNDPFSMSFDSVRAGSLLLALLAGLVSSVGSFLIVKALGSPNASTSGVMALVNINVLFTLVFSITILKEVPAGPQLAKAVGGALLTVIGSIMLCL